MTAHLCTPLKPDIGPDHALWTRRGKYNSPTPTTTTGVVAESRAAGRGHQIPQLVRAHPCRSVVIAFLDLQVAAERSQSRPLRSVAAGGGMTKQIEELGR